MVKVVKFGGSSLASAGQFAKAGFLPALSRFICSRYSSGIGSPKILAASSQLEI